MIETLQHLRSPVLLTATVLAGLQAGTYYVFSCGVMPGLARADDRTFVASLQHVNLAIVNPVFLLTFLGTPVLAAVGVASTTGSARTWMIAGLVLAVGTVLVTGAATIPLNDALAAAGDVEKVRDLAAVRADFESAWVRWNIVRTLTSAGALGCLAWAALRS